MAEFDAFISYRRADGSRVARRLRRRLLDYRLPRTVLGDKPQPRLHVYFDTMYERADEDFFAGTIVPALQCSRRLIVVNTPAARQPRRDGQQNWVEREIEVFRELPQRNNISVVAGAGAFDDPLPGKLGAQFANMEIVDLRKLGHALPLLAWVDPRVDGEIRKLVARLHSVPAEQMPLLHREDERRRRVTVLTVSAIALFVIALLSVLLVITVRSREQTRAALERSRMSLADSLALLSRRARESGDPLGAIAYASEASMQATTPLTLSAALALDSPPVVFGRTLNDGAPRVLPSAFTGPRTIIAGSFDGALRLVDAADGTTLASTRAAGMPVTAIAVARDGALVVAALRTPADVSWDGRPARGRIDVWAVEGKRLRFLRSIADAACLSLAVDAAGTLVVGATDAGVMAWPLEGGPPRALDPFTPMTSVAVSRDGRHAAAGSIAGAIRIYDIASATTLRELSLSPPSGRMYETNAMGVAFTPDGERLASGSYDGTVRLWDVRGSAGDAALPGHSAAVHAVSFSPDGRLLLSGSWDRTARLWDVGARHTRALLRAAGAAIVTAVTWSPDGSLCATVESVPAARSDRPAGEWRFGVLRTWRVADGHPREVPVRDPGNVVRLAFDHAGRLSVWTAEPVLHDAGDAPRTFAVEARPFMPAAEMVRRGVPVRLLAAGPSGAAAATGEVVTPVIAPGPRLLALDMSRDGRRVAYCLAVPSPAGDRFAGARVQVLDGATGRALAQLPLDGELGAAGPLRFTPDGESVALAWRHATDSGPGGGELLVWNTRTGRRRDLSAEGGTFGSIAISNDGAIVAASSEYGPIRLLTFADGSVTELALDIGAPAPLLAFTARGLIVATLAQLFVWDPGTGRKEEIAVPPTFMPSAIAPTADGRLLAAGNASGEIELWDLVRGERLETIRAQDGVVAEIAIDPGGSRLVSLGPAGVRLRGAVVPGSREATMHMTRLEVRDAAIVPLDADLP